MRRINDGLLEANKDTDLGRAARNLNDLTGIVGNELKVSGLPGFENVDINMDEMISYGLTNKQFQDFLKTIKVGGQSAFSRFVQYIADLFGIPREETNALSEVIQLTDEILNQEIKELPIKKDLDPNYKGHFGHEYALKVPKVSTTIPAKPAESGE